MLKTALAASFELVLAQKSKYLWDSKMILMSLVFYKRNFQHWTEIRISVSTDD